MSATSFLKWLSRFVLLEFGGGGGGGGGSTQFHAQGAPPGFDYQNAAALNQLAIGGDIQSYALSDAAFANQYPALQQAYNQWQANLGQQANQVSQGAQGQGQIMQGLANQIAGRNATPTTTDINAIRNAASTVGGAAQPIFNLGQQQSAAAQPIFNLGAQQAGLANPIIGLGGNIAGLGGQLAGGAQIPYQLGQQLLQEPIDPQAQQQMMLAGLGNAAGALGAASLGQGMAGQSAAARQLGLNTLQYGQAMRGEAMGDINQYGQMLSQAGQLQGLGGQTIGLGGQQLAGAGQQFGLGSQVLGQGAQTYGLGAQTAGQSGQLSAAAQQAQEQYAMDTANMANIYGTLQNQQAMNLMTNMQTAGNMFQKRPYGLGGTNLAQMELGQAGAFNSFQQANYATMNGIAFNQAQLATQQQQIQAQQNAANTGAMVSIGSTAAVVAATAACWVARSVYGTRDKRWKIFRHWLMNRGPNLLRRLYLRHGQSLALRVERSRYLRSCLKLLMDPIIQRTAYVELGA